MNQNNSKKQWLSQQIQIDPLNFAFIQQRSQIYLRENEYEQAISDYSKLIMLNPSRQHYLERSQLYNTTNKFSQAIRDLSLARSCSKIDVDETAGDIYLQKSVCMKNIVEVEELAQLSHQSGDPQRYAETLRQLLKIKEFQLKQQKEERKLEMQKLKKYYEEEQQIMKKMLIEQLEDVKQQLGVGIVNYLQKYENQLRKRELTQQEKCKLVLYFQSFVSEMEKYYVAAKNLGQIKDKTIKIQDFQSITSRKPTKNFALKIYKMFDKYSDQIQKIENLIENIPYIGAVFKIIKMSMKAKGWSDNIDIEHQCANIEKIAPNITIFNEYSGNLAYYLVQHYEKDILLQKKSQQTSWEKLILKIHELKHQKIGKKEFYTKLTEDEETIIDFAVLHASIIMVGKACNKLSFSRSDMFETNKLYVKNIQTGIANVHRVYEVIDDVSLALHLPQKQQLTNSPQKQQAYCEVY